MPDVVTDNLTRTATTFWTGRLPLVCPICSERSATEWAELGIRAHFRLAHPDRIARLKPRLEREPSADVAVLRADATTLTIVLLGWPFEPLRITTEAYTLTWTAGGPPREGAMG